MTDNEINKVIAEFMNENNGNYTISEYTGDIQYISKRGVSISKTFISLDALVPVWERLRFASVPSIDRMINHQTNKKEWCCHIGFKHYSHSETIQLAAAKATAMAIKELSNE